jgi:hypothetical protein
MDIDDEDFKLALKLQEEEQKKKGIGCPNNQLSSKEQAKKRNNESVSDEEFARQLYEQEK